MEDPIKAIFNKVNKSLEETLTSFPNDEAHLAVVLSALLNAVKTFAQMSGPDLQKFWAVKLYEMADELALGEPCSEKMSEYLASRGD